MPRTKAANTPAPVVDTYVREDGSEVVISPPPRALPKPEDDMVVHNRVMRERATELYRRLQRGPVPITAEDQSTVIWLRQHGVKVRAVMDVSGTHYVLDAVAPTEGAIPSGS